MTSDRDALADDLWEALESSPAAEDYRLHIDYQTVYRAAGVLLAAGWRAPEPPRLGRSFDVDIPEGESVAVQCMTCGDILTFTRGRWHHTCSAVGLAINAQQNAVREGDLAGQG
jgi:hypothetical protein